MTYKVLSGKLNLYSLTVLENGSVVLLAVDLAKISMFTFVVMRLQLAVSSQTYSVLCQAEVGTFLSVR